MVSNSDEKYMKKCFSLAKKGGRNVLPNPLVGCVVIKDGKIISTGYHKKCGEFHAERTALLKAKDIDLSGSTLYCNLEPCSHFGKTPPCTDLIIQKKIGRVVYSISDPNPKVCGEKKLIEAGISVTKGVLKEEGTELNKVFIKNITKKLPYVALKTAVTLDGKSATVCFNSKWITGECARDKVMELRNQYQGIMVGANTVKCDNPQLTCRMKGGKDPVRIVIDRCGKISNKAKVFGNDGVRVIVWCNTDKNYPENVEKIQAGNMKNFLRKLFKTGIYSILVESGGKLNTALINAHLADEMYQFVAPKILGGGLNFISGRNPVKISDCIEAKNLTIEHFKEDILLNYKFSQ